VIRGLQEKTPSRGEAHGIQNQIYIQNFQGRPSLDQTGYFELVSLPDFAEEFSKYRERKFAGRTFEKDGKLRLA